LHGFDCARERFLALKDGQKVSASGGALGEIPIWGRRRLKKLRAGLDASETMLVATIDRHRLHGGDYAREIRTQGRPEGPPPEAGGAARLLDFDFPSRFASLRHANNDGICINRP
jgi:hypothetical protein